MQGRVDLPDLPSFYHDKIEFEGKNFVPFPPGASFLLIPFLIISKLITQQQVSIIIGSFSIVLMYFLLQKFTSRLNAILLTLFFGFGTSFFWTAVVGTTWFFAHVTAIFFILISILLHFSKKDFLSGIFFALAALTRLPLIIAGLFYLFQLFKERRRFVYFLFGSFIFIPIMLTYNFLRFGNVLEMGYKIVYNQYDNSGIKVSISDNFGYFSYKNIPLHLYSFFAMPPNIEISDGIIKNIKPSPFGMGIIFTSPLLLLVFWPKFKRDIELNSAITALFCALPSFFHYAQGWVQFGYRFILDFIVFLMIILAVRFKATKLNIFLIVISIIINFWGVLWAIELGW
jgi:hypothetical protein